MGFLGFNFSFDLLVRNLENRPFEEDDIFEVEKAHERGSKVYYSCMIPDLTVASLNRDIIVLTF